MRRLAFLFAAAGTLCGAIPLAMDSTRGQEVFTTHGCVQCHALNGQGGRIAPDLGRVVDRGFTPAMLAGTMWNHAPAMWSAMQARAVERQALSAQDAADLFAAFSAAHYFEAPGDAARGKAVFTAARCSHCHGLQDAILPGAAPVSQWSALSQSVTLVANMWNHAATMQAALAKQGIAWPSLTGQNITDLLVYLRNLPGSRHAPPVFQIAVNGQGEALFQSRGCAGCHAIGKLNTREMTLDDVAASLWNHANRLGPSPLRLDRSEMSSLLGYVWASQFFEGVGNAARGAKVFRARHCSECHGVAGSGAPDLQASAGSWNGITIVSALWRHGPGMLEQMDRMGIRWPEFRRGEMADLIAYLDAGKGNNAGRKK
jgi:mono/diheme cytochrome c family protein